MSARIVEYSKPWCDQCRNWGADSGQPCTACGRVMGPETIRRRAFAAKHDVPFDPNDPALADKVARVEAAGEWWKTANESEQSLELADAADHDIPDPIDPRDVAAASASTT